MQTCFCLQALTFGSIKIRLQVTGFTARYCCRERFETTGTPQNQDREIMSKIKIESKRASISMSPGCRAAISLALLFMAYCVGAQEPMMSVRNIAAMQAINTSNLGSINTAMVLGYYQPGDRGG